MLKESESIITAPFPKELAHQARIFAAKENISRAELIRRAVRFYMSIEKTEEGTETTLPSSNQSQ